MLFQGTSVTIAYERIENLKRVYFNNKNLLEGYFDEPTVLPIPDNVSSNFPVISMNTPHNHGVLNISPVAATFEVFYDENYARDWNACFQYILDKTLKIFNLLDLITGGKYKYMGVVSNIVYDEVIEHGAKKIADVLLKASKITGLHGIDIKYTFIEQSKFYVNIALQDARKYKKILDPDVAGALSNVNQVAESIAAIVDINDKCGFNNDPNYLSNKNNLAVFIGIMTEIINKKLSLLIEKGEY